MGEGSSSIIMIGLIIFAFVVYLIFRDRIFGSVREYFEVNNQPDIAALEIRQTAVAPPRKITPSGPSPPSQDSPNDEIISYGEPAARDPYADRQEASDAPESLRNPERSFRPTPMNNQSDLAVEAGIAGEPGQTSPQSYQKFNTEPIQNSGEFMNGVYANDSNSDENYSAF